MSQYFAQCFFLGVAGNCRIQFRDRIAQPGNEYNIAERFPLGGNLTGGEMRRVRDRISKLFEPRESRVFNSCFV